MPVMPPEQLLAIAAVFVAVALLSGLATARVLSAHTPERRRLRELVAQPQAAFTGPPAPVGPVAVAASIVRKRPPQAAAAWVPKSVRDMSTSERRLANAGYRTPQALSAFLLAQFALPAVLVGVTWWWLGTDSAGWIVMGMAGIVGYMLPGFYVDHLVANRRRQIRNGLPDVLDLLIVCLEAGSSLDQAVVKASDELELAYPALAEELRILTTETRAGKPRMEAFRNLAQRTKVEDVRSLVAMLVQTDRFGTSVGQALRTLAESMRTRRRQEAEEKAGKVGVKLVFPLVLCLFPAFFIVVLGPALIKLVKALSTVAR
jgi:tight adherence protein C